MSAVTTFDSTKESLIDMLRSIREGKTQLPDFQRGWIWDDEHIKSLLASISLSYPIGAVMMLQTGNFDVRFKPRLIEGITIAEQPEPERLILDGQQRLTSLFQSLFFNQSVSTKDLRGKPIKRWYYISIEKALNPNSDRDEAIIGLSEDRNVLNFRREVIEDYSSPEKEYEAGLFPLSQIFDYSGWRRGYNKFWGHDSEKSEKFDIFETEIIDRFKQYQIPLILLRKETPKEAVCQVFEKVNTGGVSLTVFELLTATYATDNFSLRDDWSKREKLLKKGVLSNIQSDDFLQVISLLTTRSRRNQSIDTGILPANAPGISCKRKDILRLDLSDYQIWADSVTGGFERAARFLYGQKIFSAKDLAYRTQLIPLSAVLAILGSQAENAGIVEKLSRWYWSGIFGELYGGAIETRFAKDVPELMDWIDGKEMEPSSISDANFAPSRLLGLRTRNSAAYKGVHALLMRDGCQDFRTGDSIDIQMYFDDLIDIHHIFPQEWCKRKGIEPRYYDSIVNKTPLSSKTNRIISSNAPSNYLMRIQRIAGIDEKRLEQILKSHLINYELLRSDDFDNFFKARETALLERIEQAMDKAIVREESPSDENTSEYFEDDNFENVTG